MRNRPTHIPSGPPANVVTNVARKPTRHFPPLLLLSVLVLTGAALFAAYRLLPGRRNVEPAQEHSGLPAAVPELVLPTVAVEISNEQLQAEAVAEVEELQARLPEHPGAMHVAAMLFAGLRQTGKAEEIWRRCIALDSRYAGPRVGLASVLTERGRDEEAIGILTSAVADRCVSPEAYYLLAEVLTKLGRLDEAEETLRNGIALYPHVPNLWFLLGQTQNQRQQFSDSETSLLKAVELGYTVPNVYFALSTACVRQGKKEKAAEYRKRFSEVKTAGGQDMQDQPFHKKYGEALRPLVASTFAGSAIVYSKENHPAEAERAFLRALALIPENPEVLRELASLMVRTGRLADASTTLQHLVRYKPENALDHVNLAGVAVQLGDVAGAEAALRRALELRPDWVVPQISLAQLHLQTGNFEQARSAAETSIRMTPTAQGYGILAAAAQALGDTSTARTAGEMAQRLATSSPPPQPVP